MHCMFCFSFNICPSCLITRSQWPAKLTRQHTILLFLGTIFRWETMFGTEANNGSASRASVIRHETQPWLGKAELNSQSCCSPGSSCGLAWSDPVFQSADRPLRTNQSTVAPGSGRWLLWSAERPQRGLSPGPSEWILNNHRRHH